MIALLVIGILLVILLITAVIAFNSLTSAENLVESSFGDIDVQLQRRAQLIPNLIAITKGYAQHESELLEKIVIQRTSGTQNIADNDEETFRAIRKINVLAENYPELKANGPFQKLMSDLSDIERDLMSSRRFYNGAVRVYNTKLQSFPANIIGGLFAKKPAEFYVVAHYDQRQVKPIEL